MRAGGGTWHQGFIHPREETVTSFQIWVALPRGVEEGPSDLTVGAAVASRVLLGTAARHQHRLVLGDYSVHTNRESLARGESRIREVRDELRRAGRV